jgi:hypothetical protein
LGNGKSSPKSGDGDKSVNGEEHLEGEDSYQGELFEEECPTREDRSEGEEKSSPKTNQPTGRNCLVKDDSTPTIFGVGAGIQRKGR